MVNSYPTNCKRVKIGLENLLILLNWYIVHQSKCVIANYVRRITVSVAHKNKYHVECDDEKN